jgi:hypothetical protein
MHAMRIVPKKWFMVLIGIWYYVLLNCIFVVGVPWMGWQVVMESNVPFANAYSSSNTLAGQAVQRMPSLPSMTSFPQPCMGIVDAGDEEELSQLAHQLWSLGGESLLRMASH